jgi:hypothetical protein
MFDEFLRPVRRSTMPRERAVAVVRAEADATLIKAKRRYRQAFAASQIAEEPSQPQEYVPFDLSGFKGFCTVWEAELNSMSEDDREEMYQKIAPFFRGKVAHDEWRELCNVLKAIGVANRPVTPVRQRINPYAFGYPLHSGW